MRISQNSPDARVLLGKDSVEQLHSVQMLIWNLRQAGLRYSSPHSPFYQTMAAITPSLAVVTECYQGGFPAEFSVGEGSARPLSYRVAQHYKANDQRIALVYDVARVRLKRRPQLVLEDKLQRAALWVHVALLDPEREDTMNLQILSVHLSARQRTSLKKRREEAEAIAEWIEKEASKTNADLVVAGDFNAPPFDEAFEPIYKLERKGVLTFRACNGSHSMGVALSRQRETPPVEFIKDQTYLDTRRLSRWSLDPKVSAGKAFMPQDIRSLPGLASKPAVSELLNRVGEMKGGEDLAPHIVTMFFKEFELS